MQHAKIVPTFPELATEHRRVEGEAALEVCYAQDDVVDAFDRSEEHTSELQSL